VGMGFIGCEVAASLTQLGVHVTTVFPGHDPLERVLGAEVGAVIGAMHRAKGVTLMAGAEAAAFEGSDRVEAVVTADGTRVTCDFVVVGAGITPDVRAVAGTSIAGQNGIDVDERCRANAEDVYAAGDVANQLHPVFGRVRVEHYNNGEKMGAAAARSMLGSADPYNYIHTFWSDQYEHKLEYVGHAAGWDDFAVRGSLADSRFIGFYLKAGVLQAAVGFDRGGDPELDHDGDMAACVPLVAQRARPDRAALTDDRTDLWSLAK
jgi:3-phenylpropionate/trans-cinnamate dioxygenase ferredoxin reductase subunit